MGGWIKTFKELIELQQLSSNEKLVFLVLQNACSFRQPSDGCSVRVSKIAKWSGMSYWAASRSISDLERRHMIEVTVVRSTHLRRDEQTGEEQTTFARRPHLFKVMPNDQWVLDGSYQPRRETVYNDTANRLWAVDAAKTLAPAQNSPLAPAQKGFSANAKGTSAQTQKGFCASAKPIINKTLINQDSFEQNFFEKEAAPPDKPNQKPNQKPNNRLVGVFDDGPSPFPGGDFTAAIDHWSVGYLRVKRVDYCWTAADRTAVSRMIRQWGLPAFQRAANGLLNSREDWHRRQADIVYLERHFNVFQAAGVVSTVTGVDYSR